MRADAVWQSNTDKQPGVATRAAAGATLASPRQSRHASGVDFRASTDAVRTAASKASSYRACCDGPKVLGALLSQPDKVLWPDAGDGMPVTKLELARYLESVGELDPRTHRGASLLVAACARWHSTASTFSAARDGGHVEPAGSDRGVGDHKPYVVINRIEGLIAAAQIAALELHPWNCLPKKPAVPGRLVFDLDPAPAGAVRGGGGGGARAQAAGSRPSGSSVSVRPPAARGCTWSHRSRGSASRSTGRPPRRSRRPCARRWPPTARSAT